MGIGELASTREARERDDGNERRARAGSDGKEKEREGKACQILCRKSAKALENVKVVQIARMDEYLGDEAPLRSLEEFLEDSVEDLEVSIGELTIAGKYMSETYCVIFYHISWLAPLKFKCMFNPLFCCFLEGEDRTSTPKRARSILRELDEASGVREGQSRAGKHDLTPSSKMATLPNAKRFEIGKRHYVLCFRLHGIMYLRLLLLHSCIIDPSLLPYLYEMVMRYFMHKCRDDCPYIKSLSQIPTL